MHMKANTSICCKPNRMTHILGTQRIEQKEKRIEKEQRHIELHPTVNAYLVLS